MKKFILEIAAIAAGLGMLFLGIAALDWARSASRESAPKSLSMSNTNALAPDSVDLIETREDIVYRLIDGPGAPITMQARKNVEDNYDILHSRTRASIDEVLKRDFATWPKAPGAKKGAGGILDSGGPSDTTKGKP